MIGENLSHDLQQPIRALYLIVAYQSYSILTFVYDIGFRAPNAANFIRLIVANEERQQ